MTDRLQTFSNSYFPYGNYWRYRASLGTNLFQSTGKTDKLEVRHNWQIIAIASCVIIAVTLAVGIYNAVIYQNIHSALFLTTTSSTTTTTTSRAAVAAATTLSDSTTSSTTTMALTSVALATTSPAAVSTGVVTTKTPPTCPSMLPFGVDSGDEMFTSVTSTISYPSFNLWNKKYDKGLLRVRIPQGLLTLESEGDDELEIRMLYGGTLGGGWYTYYRNVSSKTDQDAIACLVNNPKIDHSFVITWFKNVTENKEELQAIQFIIALSEQSATYIIRIYSKVIPNSSLTSPVRIYYTSNTADYYYFEQAKSQDVAGQRQIFDVSKAIVENQNLTVIEEGKNCDMFIC